MRVPVSTVHLALAGVVLRRATLGWTVFSGQPGPDAVTVAAEDEHQHAVDHCRGKMNGEHETRKTSQELNEEPECKVQSAHM